jgi:hypothetical protein
VVVTGPSETKLSGTIQDVILRPLTMSRRTGMVEDMAVQVVIDFDWEDARTGRPLVRRRNFTVTESFVPTRPSGERLELGRQAVVQEAARAIVAELRSSW